MDRQTPMNIILEPHLLEISIRERRQLESNPYSLDKLISDDEKLEIIRARFYRAHMKRMDILNDPSRRSYNNQAELEQEYIDNVMQQFRNTK